MLAPYDKYILGVSLDLSDHDRLDSKIFLGCLYIYILPFLALV